MQLKQKNIFVIFFYASYCWLLGAWLAFQVECLREASGLVRESAYSDPFNC